MTSMAPMPDVEAPEVEYGRNGGMTVKTYPGSGESSPTSQRGIDELRMRVITLENRLAATHNASTVATKTLKAVYKEDAHALRVANPAPLGLFAFGLTTLLLQGAATSWTEPQTNYIVYGFALFYGGLAQFCAGMWELWRNNMFAAVAFSSYGAFWMSFAIYQILALAGPLKGAGVPHGTAMMLFLWGFFTFILWVQTFRMNVGLNALFLFLTVTFFLLGSGEYNHNAHKAGGYFGVATGAIAWYVATAELTNEVYRKTVLPLGVFSAYDTAEPERTEARPDTL